MEENALFGTSTDTDDPWKKKYPDPDTTVDEADIPDSDIDPEFAGES